jgi:flagellar motility protein MotE (MotC chaperone)
MIGRPSLLMLTAAVAAVSTIAHAVGAVSPQTEAPQTRLGVAIKKDLAERDQATARRNRALDLREQLARATETRLKGAIQDQQQQAVAGKTAGNEAADGAQYESLAQIYQQMKPARAALVLEQLDMDVQMKVVQRMRERVSGPILAAMTPKGAAELSMSLARKQARLPVMVPAKAQATPRAMRPSTPQ